MKIQKGRPRVQKGRKKKRKMLREEKRSRGWRMEVIWILRNRSVRFDFFDFF